MREAAAFYENEAPGLGKLFLDEVESRLSVLRERPLLGAVINGLRRLLLGKFPFSVIYAVNDEEIVVVAVAHQRRRPGYWAHRRPS